jgi:hypothetical protein
MEPGVTVWDRAGGWVCTAQVMHLPLPDSQRVWKVVRSTPRLPVQLAGSP